MSLLSGCFDNLTLNDTAAIDQASILNLGSLALAYILWILASFFNIPAAVLTFLATIKSKAMRKTMTNVFLQQANLCASLASLSFSIMGARHLIHSYTGVSERQCRYYCFLKIGHQTLLFSLANSFVLAVALDRFYATVQPLRYKQVVENRNPLRLACKISMFIWSVDILFYGAQFLETANPVLAVCTFTMVTGHYSFYILCCKCLSLGLLSIVLYTFAILYTKMQENKITVVTMLTPTTSNLGAIKQKHSKQLLKALVLHSVVQACTLVVCYSKLLYGAIVQDDRGSNDGSYFTILNTTSSLSNFIIYLVCLKVFRQNCKCILFTRTSTIAQST